MNGTNARSLPYDEYKEHGSCHMQLGLPNDFVDTRKGAFSITSNDLIAPRTWGLECVSLLQATTNLATPSTTAKSSATLVLAHRPPLSMEPPFVSISSHAAALSPSPAPTGPSAPPITSSLLSQPSSPPTGLSAPSITSSLPFQPPSSSPPVHNSRSARIGISVGGIVRALALLFFIWRSRSRRRNNNTSAASGEFDDDRHDISEFGEGAYHELSDTARPPELQGAPKAELSGTPRVEVEAMEEQVEEDSRLGSAKEAGLTKETELSE